MKATIVFIWFLSCTWFVKIHKGMLKALRGPAKDSKLK
jgi:hypothetical protein